MATRAFDVAIAGTLDQVHRNFVAFAKAEHAKVMRTEPRPLAFQRFVDGRPGAPEETVRANGVITYLYPRLDVVVQYAMEMLFKYSPVLSGRYRSSHTIFINGRPVSDMRGWTPGDEVVLTNFQPYARKIDLGVMTMRVAGTSQTYERAVRATNRQYGKMYRALHTWRGLVGGAVVGPGGSQGVVRGPGGRFASSGRASPESKADIRYPAIVFREV